MVGNPRGFDPLRERFQITQIIEIERVTRGERHRHAVQDALQAFKAVSIQCVASTCSRRETGFIQPFRDVVV